MPDASVSFVPGCLVSASKHTQLDMACCSGETEEMPFSCRWHLRINSDMDAAAFTFNHSPWSIFNHEEAEMFPKEQEQDGDSPTAAIFGGCKRQQQY